MLKLFEYNSKTFEKGIPIPNASDVKVTQEINGDRMLTFTCPSHSADMLAENKIVVCEGAAYRIMKLTKNIGGEGVYTAECSHVYNADAPSVHIQNIPDMMGVKPSQVLKKAFSGTPFTIMSDKEIEALGMKSIDHDGFLIDYFSTDKTNPFDVVKDITESCGKGELYADNYKIALVDRIGSDTRVRLDVTKNMYDIQIERDITDIVTRLYPYGADDAHIGSVNGGTQFIDSPMKSVYGIRCGYRNYSDYTDPEGILERAEWEFSSENENRIDVPSVNITGTYADISKLAEYSGEKLSIGDRVDICDNGAVISERVIRMEYYPYQPNNTVISIGRVKKDLFFYLSQISSATHRYGRVTTRGGDLCAGSVKGTFKNSGMSVVTGNGSISIISDLMTVKSSGATKVLIGNKDGLFEFSVTDRKNSAAISFDSDGHMRFTGNVHPNAIYMGNNVIGLDADGSVVLNGRKIATQ